MSKFDIVERIPAKVLLAAFAKPLEKMPHQALIEEGILDKDYNFYYFDWGRNALYAFFSQMPFKKIAFPEFTCPTLPEAAQKAGKQIVLLPINQETFNLDYEKLKTKKFDCLVAVHTFGNPLDIKKIKRIFPKVFIAEDCAHSLFAKYNNQLVGHEGDAVLFSFYKQIPNINGALLACKEKLKLKQSQEGNFDYLKRLIFKTSGIHQRTLSCKRKSYLPEIEPFPCRIDKTPADLVLKLFVFRLEELKKEIKKTRKIAKIYYQLAKQLGFFKAQKEEKGGDSSYYMFPGRLVKGCVKHRDKLLFALRQENIFLGRLWHDSWGAKALAESIVTLPIRGEYKKEEIELLFTNIKEKILSMVS